MASATPPAADDTTIPPSDARAEALEQRIEQLTTVIERQGDASGQLAQMVQTLQGQLSNLVSQAPRGDEPPHDASEKFKQFYGNMDDYIKKVAMEANKEAFGPHLANQAVQTRDALLAQAASVLDAEHGAGFFQEKMAEPLQQVLKEVPLEQQASRHHMEAAISAVLGRLYLNPDERKDLEGRRSKASKAREEAMNMLPSGRPRPGRPDQLEERERSFLDSLERSGFSMGEKDYLAAKGVRNIDEWAAAKAKSAGKAK